MVNQRRALVRFRRLRAEATAARAGCEVATEINPLTGEFHERTTEFEYRSDQLRREARRFAGAGWIAAILVFGFTAVDFGSLGISSEWGLLMAARAVASVAVATVALHLRRHPEFFASRAGLRMLSALEVLVLAVFLLVCFLRPDDVVTHSVSAVLMALVVAIFVPGTVQSTVVILGTFLASFITVAFVRFPPHVNLSALFANLSAATLFAYVVMNLLNRSRRSEWLATLEQRSVNERLIHEASRAEQLLAELEKQAAQDSLTGLANRRCFFELGGRLVETGRARGDSAIAVVMDVDGFKQVNDRFGHAAGDALLQAIGSALQGATRHDELVGRIGGEEFAVVAKVPMSIDGSALAERLRSAVHDAHAMSGDEAISATASVGFTKVGEDENLEAALARADRAMYSAKRAGGDRSVCDVEEICDGITATDLESELTPCRGMVETE